MGKKTSNYKFTNSCITLEDGMYILTETTKDEEKVYNLSEILGEFNNVEGVSLQISKTEELPSQQ